MPDLKSPCPYPTCDVPRGPCRAGEPTPEECPHWRRREEGTESIDTAQVQDFVRWSGSGMGHRDIGVATARGPADLVGIVGPHDAGKTTLLTSLWLHLLRGHNPKEHLFAGSLTLGGWEERAYFLRWPPGGSETAFPPHTSSGIGREASLLHLALRRGGGTREVFVTDAPGEWFTKWATNAGSKEAEGAHWIALRASGFLLVLDSAALAGRSERVSLGRSRDQSLSLISRLGEIHNCRPVAVVWSKADLLGNISDAVRGRIDHAVSRTFGGPTNEFKVSVVGSARADAPPDVLAWVLSAAAGPTAVPSPMLPRDGRAVDPLLAYQTHPADD